MQQKNVIRPLRRLLLVAVFGWGSLPATRAESTLSAVGLLHQSRMEVGRTNLTGARLLAEQAVELDPAYGDAWKQLGRVHMLANEPEAAARAFQTAEDLRPGDADIARWRLHLLLDAGRLGELASLLDARTDEALASTDEALIGRTLLGLLDSGDHTNALVLASRWARAAPEPESRAAGRALLQLLDGRQEAALNELRDLQPPPATPRLLPAVAWHRIGRFALDASEAEKACEAFQRALQFQPDWIPALRDLGWAFRRANRPADAILAWERGVRLYPQAAMWLIWIATTQMEQGRLEEAGAAADDLLTRQPDHARAQALRLAVYLISTNAGARGFEQLVRRTPGGERTAALGHAMAEQHMARYSNAVERLEPLVREQADDPELKRMLLDAYAGWATTVPTRDAMPMLERMLELSPDHPGALRDLGWALWARGDRAGAIERLERAIQLNVPNRDAVAGQLYAALVDSGQTERGIDLLARWTDPLTYPALGDALFRSHRYRPAEHVLDLAWKVAPHPARSGLLLAHTRALLGQCADTAELLLAFATETNASPEELDMARETILLCQDTEDEDALRSLRDTPVSLTRDVTERLERAADDRRADRDYAHALRLYRRVFERDPNRMSYLRAADVAEALRRQSAAVALLKDIEKRATDPAVKTGVQGRLARYNGQLAHAALLYNRSLAQQEEQPDVRFELFKTLISLGRLKAAREQITWFVQRLERGDRAMQAPLAEMWSSIAEHEESLHFWTALAQTYPDSPYYTIERARALYQLGRAQEALALLHVVTRQAQDVRAFELKAEIECALGMPWVALATTAGGLDLEYSPTLLRLRAEAAETAGEDPVAYEAASHYLMDDPGHPGLSRIAGRALVNAKRYDEATAFLSSLTNRNAAFLPALTGLRDVVLLRRDTPEAVAHAETIARQRPWDMDAQRRLAEALAEDQQLHKAHALLRSPLAQTATSVVVALAYRDVTPHEYPGRNRASQVIEHLKRLHREGYQFVTPEQLDANASPPAPSVLVWIVEADRDAVRRLDAVLKELDARAIYAGPTTAAEWEAPGLPSPEELRDMKSSGRWFIASSGPPDMQRVAVARPRTFGNPITSRSLTASGRETDTEFRARIQDTLADMAAPLPAPRTLIFPRGDYGHLSLDTDPATLELLRAETARHFDHAWGGDEPGFLTPGADPHRMPVKFVPAHWDADTLASHLRNQNPHRLLRQQMGKTLHRLSFSESDDNAAADLYANEGTLPLTPYTSHAEDSEDRQDRRHGVRYGWPLARTVQAEAHVEQWTWERDGWGREEALRYGLQAKWEPRSQMAYSASLWQMEFDNSELDALPGGSLRARLPLPPLSTKLHIAAVRKEIETLEAIRDETAQWIYGVQGETRLEQQMDVVWSGAWVDRDDRNRTWDVDGRVLWRILDWPYVGVGPYVRVADSDRDPPAYYAPEHLTLYQMYATTRGVFDRFNYHGNVQAGYGEDERSGGHFAWALHLHVEWEVYRRMIPYLKVQYNDLDTYDRLELMGGFNVSF